MELKAFIKRIHIDERPLFADRCGTSLGYLRLVAYRHKPCSETLALAIERETGGLVTVAELRPQFAADLKRSGYVRHCTCQTTGQASS